MASAYESEYDHGIEGARIFVATAHRNFSPELVRSIIERELDHAIEAHDKATAFALRENFNGYIGELTRTLDKEV